MGAKMKHRQLTLHSCHQKCDLRPLALTLNMEALYTSSSESMTKVYIVTKCLPSSYFEEKFMRIGQKVLLPPT